MDGSELLRILRVTAGAPLWAQIAFALASVATYALWARAYFRHVDPALRAALWPVAVLYAAAFPLRLLSPPFVLVLFFAVVPLYLRFWSGRWHTGERAQGAEPVPLR